MVGTGPVVAPVGLVLTGAILIGPGTGDNRLTSPGVKAAWLGLEELEISKKTRPASTTRPRAKTTGRSLRVNNPDLFLTFDCLADYLDCCGNRVLGRAFVWHIRIQDCDNYAA